MVQEAKVEVNPNEKGEDDGVPVAAARGNGGEKGGKGIGIGVGEYEAAEDI